MAKLFGEMLLKLIKAWLLKFATEEVVRYVIFEILDAIVASTENKYDDKYVAKIKEIIGG